MSENTDTYISFKKCCQIIWHRWYGPNPTSDFRNFYDEQRIRFESILTSAGIDPETLKRYRKGPFAIPQSQIDFVERLLKDYTNAPMKNFRNEHFVGIPIDELKPIVEKIDSLLVARLEGNAQTRERSKLYIKTGIVVNESITEVRTNVIEKAILDLENMRQTINDSALLLNDTDKAYLIRYYGQLMNGVSNLWHKIVSTVSDLRQQEIESIALEEMTGDQTTEEQIDELIPLSLDDIQAVVSEARKIIRQEGEDNFESLIRRPSFDDLKRVKELIQSFKGEEKK